jgi:hypothetical protein
MYSINKTDKLRKPGLNSTRLLDQLRERLRYMHYSLRTEQNYVYWARWFIRCHGVRHPKDMGGKEAAAGTTLAHWIPLALRMTALGQRFDWPLLADCTCSSTKRERPLPLRSYHSAAGLRASLEGRFLPAAARISQSLRDCLILFALLEVNAAPLLSWLSLHFGLTN